MCKIKGWQRWAARYRLAAVGAIFLLAVVAAPQTSNQRFLYLLAGSPNYDSVQSAPTTLYVVGPGASIVTVRRICEGLFGADDDLSDRIYVLDGAMTRLSIIHKDDPEMDDSVSLYDNDIPGGEYQFVWAGWGAAKCGNISCAVFPNRNGKSASLNAVLGSDEKGRQRIISGSWVLYGSFRFEGAPGGPMRAIPKVAAVVKGTIRMPSWLGTPFFVIAQAPESLDAGGGGERPLNLDADTPEYLVVSPIKSGGGPGPLPVYFQHKRTGAWDKIDAPTAFPRSQGPSVRLFGNWLATIVKIWEGNNPYRPSPGQENERDTGSGTATLLNVRRAYDMQGDFYMPGQIELQNLEDHRRISITTGQQDSEVLDVSANGQVLYRVNDEILSARIQGAKLGPATLVVKGADVPEVHWVFWSAAPPPEAPAEPTKPAGVVVR